MKKTIFLAAAFAALVACTGEITPSGDSFEEGQVVTLKVSSPSITKVSSNLNKDGKTVDFLWEEGDQILVTAQGKSSIFTLKDGAGASSATFEGEMPAKSSLFDIQYPTEDPDIINQEYSGKEAIPHNKMKFTAIVRPVISQIFTLNAQNAALRLNFYGKDITVSKIEIKDADNTYTLVINPAVVLPKTDPKAFFIVLPAGEYKFSAEVFDDSAESICKFETTEAQRFNVGEVLNMPAKEVYYNSNIERLTEGTPGWSWN